MVACSDDDDNNNLPIKGLEIPLSTTTPVKPGSSVTIKGEGFTQASEIWFRQIVTRAASDTDVKATVTEVNSTGITFIAPEVYGNQSVLLKENGKEYELGKMTFEAEPEEVEDIKILPKKITKVIEHEGDDNDPTIYEYTYDGQGKIKSVRETESDGEVRNYICSYTTDQITMNADDKYIAKLLLEDGRAKSYEFKEIGVTYDFSYNGEYLSETKGKEDGDPITENFSFISGKLTAYNYVYDEEPEIKGSAEFFNVKQLNNLNIDLFSFIASSTFDTFMGESLWFGVCGKRSQYLPEEIKCTEPKWDEDGDIVTGYETYVIKFDYKMDGDYIKEITLTSGEEGEEEVEWRYEIFYEE